MLLAKAGGEPAASIAVRLGHHLDWFLWDEQTRGSDVDRADTLSGQAVTGGLRPHTVRPRKGAAAVLVLLEEKLAMSTVIPRELTTQSNRELCEEESP